MSAAVRRTQRSDCWIMTGLRSIVLFVLAAVAEIGGAVIMYTPRG